MLCVQRTHRVFWVARRTFEEHAVTVLRVIGEVAIAGWQPDYVEQYVEIIERAEAARAAVALVAEREAHERRGGRAIDDEEDYLLDTWAGVLPLMIGVGEPIPDPRLSPDIEIPEHIAGWLR